MIQNKDITIDKLTPGQNFVIIKSIELFKGAEKTESGLITKVSQNKSVIDRPTFGTVLSIGPEVVDIKPNDNVFWDETAGQDIEVKDGNYIIMRDTSILGNFK